MPPSFWYGFADIYRVAIGQAIQLRVFFVYGIFARVIDGIDPGAEKRLWRGKCMNGRAVKEPEGILDEFGKGIVFVYVFASIEGLGFHGRMIKEPLKSFSGRGR